MYCILKTDLLYLTTIANMFGNNQLIVHTWDVERGWYFLKDCLYSFLPKPPTSLFYITNLPNPPVIFVLSCKHPNTEILYKPEFVTK